MYLIWSYNCLKEKERKEIVEVVKLLETIQLKTYAKKLTSTFFIKC